jgi:UDP-glucose:(heptosyl)LPS alpha-1,3-glucosyltransferase
MNNHLSIAMAIYRLVPRGGLEDHCIRLAQALAQRGHRIVIFTAEPAELPGIEVHPIPEASLPPSNHRRMETLARLAGKAIAAGNFDRSIAFQMMPGTGYVFLADPIRQACGRNSWKWLTLRHHVYKSLEARTLGPASKSKIIGLSERQMQSFAHRYDLPPDRFRIAPPTLNKAKIRTSARDLESRDSFRRKLGISGEAPVLMAAALHPWTKGLDRTITALEQLPDAVLLVAGMEKSGSMAANSVRQANIHGVLERIGFLGFLGPDELLEAMSAADVLAHPARRDVTGAIILESIVNGLPVVATEVCGFSVHIEQSGAGSVLTEPFSKRAYVKALQQVIAEGRTLSENGTAYGKNPWLTSGIDQVCDWIENGF